MFLMRSVLKKSPRQCLVSRNFAKTSSDDPGIRLRKKILNIDKNEEYSDLEDLESDFLDVHKSHHDYIQEEKLRKEKEKLYIVKQKYFKEKFPNFLTWHDKEQIRYLHRTDPEEWTIDRLAEGFPALPDVIKKIVKSSWSKKSQSKITNHDASVQQNWKLFKDGQMPDLPKDLVEHLNKFTNRSLNFHPFECPPSEKTVVHTENKKKTEFSDIINSYKKLKEESPVTEDNLALPEPEPPESSRKSRRPVTFNLLHHNLTKRMEGGGDLDLEERTIIKRGISEEPKVEGNESNLIELTQKYSQPQKLQHYKKEERQLAHLQYPERITIPRKLLKENATYKLNDCYYDTDGEFLYRVPGMG